MSHSAQAEQKIAAAPLDIRLALIFSPEVGRSALTSLFALYLEIHEVPVECRDPGVADIKLSWWQQEIDALYAGKPRHPLTAALAPHLRPLINHKQAFLDLIAGARMDISGSSLTTYEDVKRYCYRHSGALAELSALLAGAHSKDALLAARLFGNCKRLAYITTVGTVEALRGRVYFATEDLKAHGVDRHVHGETGSEAPVISLLEDYANRTRALHQEALATAPATEQHTLVAWRALSALALKRIAKLKARGFTSRAEPVELHPLNALFTAWRGARRTG